MPDDFQTHGETCGVCSVGSCGYCMTCPNSPIDALDTRLTESEKKIKISEDNIVDTDKWVTNLRTEIEKRLSALETYGKYTLKEILTQILDSICILQGHDGFAGFPEEKNPETEERTKQIEAMDRQIMKELNLPPKSCVDCVGGEKEGNTICYGCYKGSHWKKKPAPPSEYEVASNKILRDEIADLKTRIEGWKRKYLGLSNLLEAEKDRKCKRIAELTQQNLGLMKGITELENDIQSWKNSGVQWILQMKEKDKRITELEALTPSTALYGLKQKNIELTAKLNRYKQLDDEEATAEQRQDQSYLIARLHVRREIIEEKDEEIADLKSVCDIAEKKWYDGERRIAELEGFLKGKPCEEWEGCPLNCVVCKAKHKQTIAAALSKIKKLEKYEHAEDCKCSMCFLKKILEEK